ncbi:MAG: low molecular weight protein tyrosine phosphatase family protein [Rhizomicrobium sp.]|jgi:predicted protein tyrosine phosphatase
MKRVLFVCGRNRARSPTAENVFANYPGIETASAGTSGDAETPLTAELVEWADIIFVMEKSHRAKLSARFRGSLRNARIVCLDIPDKFAFMDAGLVRLLKSKVAPHLR